MIRSFVILSAFIGSFSLKAASQLNLKPSSRDMPQFRASTILPQNFYNKSIGYFCKKEDQLQQRTGLNLFIRLGSKTYVDYLERKPNAIQR